MTQVDKAGSDYWDDAWSGVPLPKTFDSQDACLDNYVNLQLHRYFKNLFGEEKGFSILEIGCANSIWQEYFYRHFKAKVYGLDYSKVGCERSREILAKYNVPGEIIEGDLFNPPKDIQEKFDYVISFGVVEHFEDTPHCLKACAKLLKPGGKLITLIPNMPGVVGWIQKYVDRAVYDVHVPLTLRTLSEAHSPAGLSLEQSSYFMGINLSVVNSGAFMTHPLNTFLRHVLSGVSKVFWMLERMGIKLPVNRATSPYIVTVSGKN